MGDAIEITPEQRQRLFSDERAVLPIVSEGEVVAFLGHDLAPITDPAVVKALRSAMLGPDRKTRPAAEVLEEIDRRFFDGDFRGGEAA